MLAPHWDRCRLILKVKLMQNFPSPKACQHILRFTSSEHGLRSAAENVMRTLRLPICKATGCKQHQQQTVDRACKQWG